MKRRININELRKKSEDDNNLSMKRELSKNKNLRKDVEKMNSLKTCDEFSENKKKRSISSRSISNQLFLVERKADDQHRKEVSVLIQRNQRILKI